MSDDEAVVKRTLEHMKGTYEAWQAAREAKSPVLDRWIEKSCMLQEIPKRMFALAAANNFTVVCEDMRHIMNNVMDSLIGQSLVVENCLKRERWAETKEQASTQMRSDRIWWKPIQTRVLSETFKMPEVLGRGYLVASRPTDNG